MANDFILELDKIPGESTITGHEKKIEISSFSWGVNQMGITHTGTGSGAGKSSVHDLTFSKATDKTSTALALACCTGTHIANAKLICRKSSGENAQVEYMVYTLKNVFVTSFNISGHDGAGVTQDSFSLNFGEINMVHKTQAADGKGKNDGEMTYNIAKQEKK